MKLLSRQANRTKLSGFTIIEVMIVLAIAGLIMLIVFLAVPALQRSSRNTQRKSDIASIAGGLANYITNNGGSVPTNISNSGADLLICGNAGCTGNTETAKLGYYDASVANTITKVSTASPTSPTKDTVVIDVGYGCNSSNTGIGVASSRTVAVLYAVETSSSDIAQQCSE